MDDTKDAATVSVDEEREKILNVVREQRINTFKHFDFEGDIFQRMYLYCYINTHWVNVCIFAEEHALLTTAADILIAVYDKQDEKDPELEKARIGCKGGLHHAQCVNVLRFMPEAPKEANSPDLCPVRLLLNRRLCASIKDPNRMLFDIPSWKGMIEVFKKDVLHL